MRWSALLLAALPAFANAAAGEPPTRVQTAPIIAQAQTGQRIGQGIFGTRVGRKDDGSIDWDVTFGRKAPKTEPPAAIDVMPRFAQAGATFRVRLRIPRDPRNRVACFSYDGPEFSESCWDHGPVDAVTTTKFVTLRVGGFYSLALVLKRNDGSAPLAAAQACVIGFNMSAEDCFPEGVAGDGTTEQSAEQSSRPPEPEPRK